MKTLTIIFALATVIFAAGCLPPIEPTEVSLQSSFDANAAQELLRKGNNTIRGNALVRQAGGGVVTCAGAEVLLIPATAHATERMLAEYGHLPWGRYSTYAHAPERMVAEYGVHCPSCAIKHIAPATEVYQGYGGRYIKFVPDPVEYRILNKKTVCDAQGDFVFKEVSDGVFYVTTIVSWIVPKVHGSGTETHGGSLMQRVTVSGGETKEIVLSP